VAFSQVYGTSEAGYMHRLKVIGNYARWTNLSWAKLCRAKPVREGEFWVGQNFRRHSGNRPNLVKMPEKRVDPEGKVYLLTANISESWLIAYDARLDMRCDAVTYQAFVD
jgi:hypothetical protein